MNDFIGKQAKKDLSYEEEFGEMGGIRLEHTAAVMNEADWESITEIADLLEPIATATEAMCSEQIPTLSFMMPFFDGILDHFKEKKKHYRRLGKKNETADTIADGIEVGAGKMKKYFEVSSDLAVLATVLDPRLKMSYYANAKDSNYYNIVKSLVMDLGNAEEIPFLRVALKNTKNQHLPKFLQQRGEEVPETISIVEELTLYIKSSPTPVDTVVLSWWKHNRGQFPKLAVVAQKVLAIPATSAASERVFSKARLVMPWNRCRLAPETFQAIMCLRDWLKVGADFEE